jgi:TonB family protein
LATPSYQEKDTANGECDFKQYKYLVIDHFPSDWILKKVQPKYPNVAKDAKIEGSIHVQLLVDREGNVFKACVTQGHPLFQEAAKAAALEYKFKKNFGFKSLNKQWGIRYVQTWVIFNFRLDDKNSEEFLRVFVLKSVMKR